MPFLLLSLAWFPGGSPGTTNPGGEPCGDGVGAGLAPSWVSGTLSQEGPLEQWRLGAEPCALLLWAQLQSPSPERMVGGKLTHKASCRGGSVNSGIQSILTPAVSFLEERFRAYPLGTSETHTWSPLPPAHWATAASLQILGKGGSLLGKSLRPSFHLSSPPTLQTRKLRLREGTHWLKAGTGCLCNTVLAGDRAKDLGLPKARDFTPR